MARLHSKNWKRRSHFLSSCALCTLVAASSLLGWQGIVQGGPHDVRASRGTTIVLPEGAMALKNQPWLGSDIGAWKITAPVVPVLRMELSPPEIEPSPPEDEEIARLAAYRVSDSELEATRGGFTTASGLIVNIGITGLVFANGTLVSTIPIFNSFTGVDTGVVASGVNVTRGGNGGFVFTTDIDIVPDIVATGVPGPDVDLTTDPAAGTQVIHHISAAGLAVEVINSNNNLFLQTQTDIAIVLENWDVIAPTLLLSGVANDLNHSLSSAILEALGF